MRLGIALATTGLLFASTVWAEPNAVLYQLQERCGKTAAEVFRRDYENVTIKGAENWHFNYQAHYNAHLNKCFFLEISKSFEKNNTTSYRLFDLLENREYGGFSEINNYVFCNVLDTACMSKTEWDNLIKPYMEE
jgi:hypothetical protein